MIRPRIFLKIFLSTTVLVVLTGLVAFMLASANAREDVREETRVRLRHQLELLHELFAPAPPTEYSDGLQERMRDLAGRTEMRITIVRPDGLVLADSHKDPRGMDNHADRPEIQASYAQRYGESIRQSETLGQEMVYIARAIPAPGPDAVLCVRASQALVHLEPRMGSLRDTLLGSLGFALLVGFFGAWFLARRVAKPLQTVSEAAAAIAEGDYARRVPITTQDEVGDLGTAFNAMAGRLEQEVTTIRRDQRELRAILRGMVEGVVAIDTEERVVLMNEAACAILGVEEAEAAKRPIWESIRIPPVTAALAAAVKKQSVQTSKVRLPRGASDRIVNLHASPLVGDGGVARGAVIVLDDVTEREQVEAIRRDFIANASHELKTPLASVRGLVETILDDDAMDVGVRQGFLERVLRQVHRLGDLVQEMLQLSRLETQGARVATRAWDARDALREVVDDVQPLSRERNISVTASLPEEPCPVLAEPEALRRIVGNLLDNAVKYSTEGGTVKLRAAPQQGDLVIEVQDDGPGIPSEKHQRIFERFYRVDEGRSRELGGTGLGLAIVKHLVQALGGRIELESEPGQGSTFRVTLRME